MSYKSKHTGAQVDEAVSKVLNGGIEVSDKISVFNNEWNCEIGEIPSFDTTEKANLEQFLKDNENKFVAIKFIIADAEAIETEVFYFDCDYANDSDISGRLKGNKYCYGVESMDDNLISNVYPIVPIVKTDWNAQEGEPGYIENRPGRFVSKKFGDFAWEIKTDESGEYLYIKNRYSENDDGWHNIKYLENIGFDENIKLANIGQEKAELTKTLSIYGEEMLKLDYSFSFGTEIFKIYPTNGYTANDLLNDSSFTETKAIKQNYLFDSRDLPNITSDWNAQEGEAGYIENRPFGFDDFKEVEWYIDETGSYYYCTEVSNQIKFNGIVYDIFNYEVTSIDGVGGVIVAEDGIHAHGVNEDNLKSVLVKIESKIDEKYLPNTVLKTTPQTLSNADKNQARANLGISTPDWNAQAGEAGYIDNKPFGEGFKAVNWFYDDGASFCITPMISNKVKYEGVIYEIPDNADEPVSLGDGSIALGKYPHYDDNLMHVMCYGIQDESDERLKKILFKTDVKLNSDNIDDTVIKTTPQTLTNTAKNQALSNLGIDNTKYMLSIAPDNKFNIQEFINKFGFIAELNDDGYGHYVGCLVVTNKELFLDNVLCCGFNTSLAKCIYVKDEEVVFFFEEGLEKGNVKVSFAENDIDSTPLCISWEPVQ